MTSDQKQNLDRKLSEFNSFMELHEYANKNNIIFDNEEWEEYSNKMKKILESRQTNIVDVNLDNLILPPKKKKKIYTYTNNQIIILWITKNKNKMI